MTKAIYTDLGDVVVVPAGTTNPCRPLHSLRPDERAQQLGGFFRGQETPGYEFWIAPVSGGAKKITSATEANVDPDVVAYYFYGARS